MCRKEKKKTTGKERDRQADSWTGKEKIKGQNKVDKGQTIEERFEQKMDKIGKSLGSSGERGKKFH